MMTTTTLPQNPFPGMNPYLEEPGLWPDVHHSVIVGLRNYLAHRLRPDYRVTIQERVYVTAGPNSDGVSDLRMPDVAVLSASETPTQGRATQGLALADPVVVQLPEMETEKEIYLEVVRVGSREVITAIELLSPTNKSGSGRRVYQAKRAQALYSMTHLVEIDLLRAGRPMPVLTPTPASHYRILVADARRTEHVANLYPFGIHQSIPNFVMPLAKGDEDIAVNLNEVINAVYVDGGFDLDIDYQTDPEPPLSDGDRAWLDQLLRERGLRKTAN